jgi:hypothetical protein
MAFDVSHRFWYFFGFHWILGIFMNSLLRTSVIPWFLTSVLFSFHVFEVFFFCILCCWVLVLYHVIWYDSKGYFYFLELFRLALCPKIWSILEKVPWDTEKNVYFLAVGWNALSTISIRLMYVVAKKFLCLSFLWMIYLFVRVGYSGLPLSMC